MEITLTVPESILTQLQQQAVQLNMSLNELALTFFRNGIDHKPRETPAPVLQDEVGLPSLEEAIARVKTIPPRPGAIVFATQTAAELTAELEKNPPSEELMTFDEMWPLWQEFEQELKTMDEADALRDRMG